MKKETWISTGVLLILWFLASLAFDNEFLLPGPFDVVTSMINQIQRPDFLSSIFMSTFRTLYGCALSLFAGAFLGICCGKISLLKQLFEPVHQIIKTIPNITYMLLILIWLGQEKSVSVIVFCLLFPSFYSQFLTRTETLLEELHDLLQIYPVSTHDLWVKVLLPNLSKEVFSALKTGIGMGFKICVMAEILGQVGIGIGRQMNYARLHLELASVFGWTIWLVFISVILQKFVDFVQKITYKN